ncbi:hypothetical protein GCM10022226_32650 [Sphaerisporangium flaviroseum]|uniref:Carbohydrate ABC transporter permease n=1 Tax=Sphaerisporangium flaviroseum TaxID=509199 RepID=A0ABP7I3W6_9ACTN
MIPADTVTRRVGRVQPALLRDVLLDGLRGQFGTDYPTLMAGALVCSIPLVLVFLALQPQFFRGIANSGLKG